MPDIIDPRSLKAAWPYGATLEEAMHASRNEVRRLYAILLQREPEADRLELTAAALAEGRVVASDVVATLITGTRFDPGQVATASAREVDIAKTEGIVQEAYRLLLARDADDSALQAFSSALANDKMTVLDMVKELIGTEEFVQRSLAEKSSLPLQLPETEIAASEADATAFRSIVQDAFNLLLLRNADEAALLAFSTALARGELTVLGLVGELVASEEFIQRSPPEKLLLEQLPPQSGSDMDAAPFHSVVREAFNLLLSRDPDEPALLAFSSALAHGELTVLDMVGEVLTSTEFGSSALRLPCVARHVVSVVIRTMMRREVEEATLNAYADSLRDGTALNLFLSEMLESPEFHNLMQYPTTGSQHQTGVPGELARLAEGLLVNKMVAEGCSIAAAPYHSSARQPAPEKQMAALLRTLAMVGNVAS